MILLDKCYNCKNYPYCFIYQSIGIFLRDNKHLDMFNNDDLACICNSFVKVKL